MPFVSEATKSISAFASDFMQECVESTSDNVVCSPLSVANALMLLAQGANGKTLTELANALHLSNVKNDTANQFCEYIELLVRGAGSAELTIVNNIYVQKEYQLLDAFSAVAVKKFQSSIESLDFGNNVESAKIINRFIEEKTKGTIKNVINPGIFHADDRVMLINAVHFKAKWASQFGSGNTHKSNFYIDETKTVSVDFMGHAGDLHCGAIDELDATALEMKFRNSNFSFVIVLPNSRTGLRALQAKLKNFDLSKINQQMREQFITVVIPKFKVTCNIDLKSILKKMGMNDMFVQFKADFTDLSKEIPGEPLYVTNVAHIAYIDVNEAGVEAGGVANFTFRGGGPGPLTHFIADHPFVFYIWDRLTQTPLFSGQITNFTE